MFDVFGADFTNRIFVKTNLNQGHDRINFDYNLRHWNTKWPEYGIKVFRDIFFCEKGVYVINIQSI